MSEDQLNQDNQEQDEAALLAAAELENLKARAEKLGVKFHPSIGADKLREKIKEALAEGQGEVGGSDEPKAASAPVEESPAAKKLRLKREGLKLVRVRITNMNPFKKEWEGEIFTVSNNAVGTVKRYVPFNTEDGWHVESILLEQLRERRCQIFVTEKDSRGNKVRKGKLIREFAIEVLDPLTEEELADLAQRQAMAKGQ
jgi:hypothetical protein